MDELNTVSKPVKLNKSHQVKLWGKCRNFHYILTIKYVIWYISTECCKECCSRFMQLLRPVLHNLWLGSFWPFRHQRFLIYKKKTSWTRHNRHGNMYWILLELIFKTQTRSQSKRNGNHKYRNVWMWARLLYINHWKYSETSVFDWNLFIRGSSSYFFHQGLFLGPLDTWWSSNLIELSFYQ